MYVFIDTETTGLFSSIDKIIEISAFKMKNGILCKKYFHTYLSVDVIISYKAYLVHGVKNSNLLGKPSFNLVLNKFLNFIKGCVLIFHNAKFDVSFIKSNSKGLFRSVNFLIIDTLKLAKKLFPYKSVSLRNLCLIFNIHVNNIIHSAKLDSYLLSKVFNFLLFSNRSFIS